MTDSKTHLIINAIVNKENIEELQSYLGKIMPVFAKHGGKPLAKYKTIDQLIGESSPEMIAIIEFPSADVIKQLIKEDDFTALANSRAKAFTKLNLMICTEM